MDIVVLQHGGFLVEGMAGDEGNVLNPHAFGIQLRGKRMPEGMRLDAFAKA